MRSCKMVLRGIGSVLVARREIVHRVGSYSEPRGTRAPAVKDFISESSLGCGEWMVTEARGDHCTGSSNTTIQYYVDCKIIPTKIRPNPATPRRRSGRFSILRSRAGLKRKTSAFTVPAAKPSLSPNKVQEILGALRTPATIPAMPTATARQSDASTL